MKKIILLSSIVTVLMSCGSSGNGELVGVQQREFFNPTDPYGMVFIPQGSFVMGPSDQDVPFANVSAAKRVSVGNGESTIVEVQQLLGDNKVRAVSMRSAHRLRLLAS